MNEILQFPPPKVQPLDRWTWLKAVSSDTGPSKWTARLVAHTLAMHMKADLSDCFPSQPTIARAANLSERAVRYAIQSLVAEGFLLVDKVRNEGRVWCKSVYIPTLPTVTQALREPSRTLATVPDDRHAMPVQVAQDAGTGGTPCREYRHTVPTNQTPNLSIKQSLKRIDRKSERILNALQEKDRKEASEKEQEVLREKDRSKIRTAIAAFSLDPSDYTAIGRMTQLPPYRIEQLMEIAQ